MNIFIILAIIAANVISVLLIYQFIKKLPKMEKIVFIAVSFAVTYILVSIVYGISGIGVEDKINETAKDFITYLFVPVNIILLVPFIAIKYNKYRFKEISKKDFINRVIVVLILAIIVMTIECFYFKDMKNNIKLVNDNIVESNKQNNVINNELENANIVENVNEIISNEEIQD